MKNYCKNLTNSKNGYITLSATIMIGSIVLTITLALLLIGLNSSITSFGIEQSFQAKAIANTCAEYALLEINRDAEYVGSDNIAVGQGICTYDVINGAGDTKEIEANGIVDNTERKIKVIISETMPVIEISSWEDIVDL